jgi:probable phosphoglycerate mutase
LNFKRILSRLKRSESRIEGCVLKPYAPLDTPYRATRDANCVSPKGIVEGINVLMIWLIRHAESEANAGLRTSDPSKIGLTPTGIEQAKCIEAYFDTQPSLIVTSSYTRTKQTAEPVMWKFQDIQHEEWPVHEFTYLSPLHCQQTTREERRPMVHAYWHRCDPFYIDGDGAESFSDMMSRVEDTLRRLERSEDDFIAIFSHGIFIRAILWSLLSSPVEMNSNSMKRFKAFIEAMEMPNGSIVKLKFWSKEEVWFSKVMDAHIPADLSVRGR